MSQWNSGPYGQGTYGGAGYEDPEVKGFGFSDQTIRRGFIRKVYSILAVQLVITLAFICWLLYHVPSQKYVQNNPAFFYVSLATVFVTLICLACCGEIRRKAPMNFIFLLIFTVAESFMLATAASTYKADAVAMAVGITAAVCFGLTLFAFQTKWDFTMMGGILFVAVLILFIFGIVAIFFHNKIVQMVYASLGALIFSVYLVYDTQLMMGGKHKYSISPEEYIFAAINLYVDVINIFMYILAIIGHSRD
ncbi:protein lifeguard 1 isoform X3 [Leptinotarsa decemlineata]|uniref:protein lifeguard 1 isoform X3 n=1 Tax=Leptinotarsa decemlineata TaxID=7539 RepID=UPI003D308C24